MKRFFRWVLILILLTLLGVAVSGVIVRRRVMTKPTWYGRPTNPIAQRTASRIADQKLIDTFGAARDSQAREAAARHASGAELPTTVPADPIMLVLSDEEMNAFFRKWASRIGWTHLFGGTMADPEVIMDGADLILAADVKGTWNTVISLHFEPKLEDGQLNMRLMNVMAGMMALPRPLFSGYQSQLEEMVEKNLPVLRKKANITPEGWVNSAAVDAAMSELLLHALRGELAEPVLFFPDITKPSRSLPMRVIGVEIVDKTLKLTVLPMNPTERGELLKHLRDGQDAGDPHTP